MENKTNQNYWLIFLKVILFHSSKCRDGENLSIGKIFILMASTQLTITMLSIDTGKKYYSTLWRVWGKEGAADGKIKQTVSLYGRNIGWWH